VSNEQPPWHHWLRESVPVVLRRGILPVIALTKRCWSVQVPAPCRALLLCAGSAAVVVGGEFGPGASLAEPAERAK
jgi:hypothetical protein